MTYFSSCLNQHEPWFQFKHDCVRHLAFTLASPNIISQVPEELRLETPFELHSTSFWLQQYDHYVQRLKALDQDPSPLLEFLGQLRSTRIGLRFEYMLWFWLLDTDYHTYKLIGHSIQKTKGTQTIGELDFLVYNTTEQRIEHWEVALKYYLGEKDLSLPYWYGLNREDTLLKKLAYFTERQFQFEEALGHRIDQRFAVLKGQLYSPQHMQHSKLPKWLNSHRRIGYWGFQTQADFRRLTRHEWMCPQLHGSTTPALWWSNGLYVNTQNPADCYMFRQAPAVPWVPGMFE